MKVDSTPPDSAELEFDLEAASLRSPLDIETPIPRCLNHGSSLAKAQSAISHIPPAPRLPQFELQSGAGSDARIECANSDAEVDIAEATQSAIADTSLGDPDPALATDRVLPGSPALVSTFRPKPLARGCYSVTYTLAAERVYRACRPPGHTGTKK